MWFEYLKARKYQFKKAAKVLHILKDTHKLGLIGKVLSGIALLDILVDYSYDSTESFLGQKGLHHNTPISIFVAQVLMKDMECLGRLEDQGWIMYVGKNDHGIATSAILQHLSLCHYNFFSNGSEETSINQMIDAYWQKHPCFWMGRNQADFIVEDLGDPGAFVSDVPISHYTQRIQHNPQAILIRGPSGCGKSTLARILAQHVSQQRVLKFDFSITSDVERFNQIPTIVKQMKPSVIILDDVDLDKGKTNQIFLSLLESLHGQKCLVIATLMLSPEEVGKSNNPGCLYYPGMRPGRIDEIFDIGLPNQTSRKKILEFYQRKYQAPISPEILDALAKETNGLTGAYLDNLIQRITAYGVQSWQDELKTIRLMAPNYAKLS